MLFFGEFLGNITFEFWDFLGIFYTRIGDFLSDPPGNSDIASTSIRTWALFPYDKSLLVLTSDSCYLLL